MPKVLKKYHPVTQERSKSRNIGSAESKSFRALVSPNQRSDQTLLSVIDFMELENRIRLKNHGSPSSTDRSTQKPLTPNLMLKKRGFPPFAYLYIGRDSYWSTFPPRLYVKGKAHELGLKGVTPEQLERQTAPVYVSGKELRLLPRHQKDQCKTYFPLYKGSLESIEELHRISTSPESKLIGSPFLGIPKPVKSPHKEQGTDEKKPQDHSKTLKNIQPALTRGPGDGTNTSGSPSGSKKRYGF